MAVTADSNRIEMYPEAEVATILVLSRNLNRSRGTEVEEDILNRSRILNHNRGDTILSRDSAADGAKPGGVSRTKAVSCNARWWQNESHSRRSVSCFISNLSMVREKPDNSLRTE